MLRPKPKSIWLDHIVLASSNIESTVSEFHQLTGILPIFGGSHVGRGTCNYLTSLGTNSYLEIVGEDPNQIDTVTQMKAKQLSHFLLEQKTYLGLPSIKRSTSGFGSSR